MARVLGALATLGAYSGQSDLTEVMIQTLPRLERTLSDKGIEFSDLVEAKTARVGFEEEVGFLWLSHVSSTPA